MRPPTGRRVPNGSGGRRPPIGRGPTVGRPGPDGWREYWRRFDKRWLVFIPVFFVVMLAAMYASIACTMDDPAQIILGKKGLEILDRDGKVIYTIGDEPGSSRIVPLEEISPNLINATIATEDANFWDNPGVNVKGILRAAYENVSFWDGGGVLQGSGGSSITQQLAKNLYIPPDERVKRSPLRKLKETMIAFELSRRYDKEQILEWYLSNIFYGQGAYGIESASYRYLNKPPSELTLAEAAMLAGIPRSPAFYDPITNREASDARKEEVLELMVRHDIISEEEAAAALAEEVVIREGRIPASEEPTEETNLAVHFALYVRDLLPSLIGQQDAQKQLRVTTTLDYDMQVKADEILKTNLDKFEPQYGASNGALVAMDPKTGEILAMVGSHDFTRDDISGQVNNARSLNQPGSTMKPITYLSAFLKGWSPSTRIVDEPLKISDGSEDFTLTNADKRYRGDVSARVALGSSLNVPAVKALRFAGLRSVYDLAKKMGITSLKDIENYGDAFTLGGADVTLLDMTYAYSVFANQGMQSGMDTIQELPSGSRSLDPIAILKIETVDGDTLWEADLEQERVVPANAAFLITHVLADDNARVSGFGANSALNLGSRPGAVKTGSSDATRDAWAIGYTPQLVGGVWVGNANNAPMPGGTSTLLAAPIWRSFMLSALQGQEALPFPVPDGVRFENGEVFMDGNARAGTATPEATSTRGPATATSTPAAASPSPTAPARTSTPRPDATSTNVPTSTPQATETPRATSTRPPNSTSTPQPTSTPSSGQSTPSNQGGQNQTNQGTPGP